MRIGRPPDIRLEDDSASRGAIRPYAGIGSTDRSGGARSLRHRKTRHPEPGRRRPGCCLLLEPGELAKLVHDTRTAWEALGTVRTGPKESEQTQRPLRRSLYIAEDIKAGERLTPDEASFSSSRARLAATLLRAPDRPKGDGRPFQENTDGVESEWSSRRIHTNAAISQLPMISDKDIAFFEARSQAVLEICSWLSPIMNRSSQVGGSKFLCNVLDESTD